MARCISFTTFRDHCYRRTFTSFNLTSTLLPVSPSTTLHIWTPRAPSSPDRPALLLIHGFGANATWQWSDLLRLLTPLFSLYIPDLLFFGDSHTALPDRSETFQAATVKAALDLLGVHRFSLAGVSYGGFVGYRIAEMWPESVDRVVLCCAGVCLEEADLGRGLFVVEDVGEAAGILLPQSPEKLRQLMRLSFWKRPAAVPSCFLSDFIDVMCTEYVEEKTELIHALIKDRKLSDLPKITQPTLIIWGEEDQIFPLELGYRLNRHLEDNSQLVVIKNAGHAVNLEKSKEFGKHLKAFLTDPSVGGYNRYKVMMDGNTILSAFKNWLRVTSEWRENARVATNLHDKVTRASKLISTWSAKLTRTKALSASEHVAAMSKC